jgi:hypothetical protein
MEEFSFDNPDALAWLCAEDAMAENHGLEGENQCDDLPFQVAT